MSDPCPWLPPHFEPLEILADGKRLTREECGANDAGRETLIPRVEAARARVFLASPSALAVVDRVIEVGSWAGAHALKLAHFLKPPAQILCVDTWAGTDIARADSTTSIAQTLTPGVVYSVFRKNTKHEPRITAIRSPSVVAGRAAMPESAACVFIDADHSYEAVRDDLRAWWPVVAKGGLFAGHDYHLFPGVKRAVDEWAKANGHDVIVEGECWFVEKSQ